MKIVNSLSLCALVVSAVFVSGCDKKDDKPADASSTSTAASAATGAKAGTLAITVDGSGYHPAEIKAPAGKPVHLVFTRTSDAGCGQQLVFPSLNIRKDLPLDQAVPVDITMPASGSVAFTCGMAMYKGAVVAE